MSKFSYKTVNTKTVEGLKLAEKLKSDGWKIISTGLFNITFEKIRG